jgi:hypothetical protein
MGSDALVMDELDNGRKLIEQLIQDGFDIHLAFWVKETYAGQWFLYLASPMVESPGPTAAYRLVLPIVDRMPELGIDPFSIKLVGLNDSMTTAARKALRSPASDHPPGTRPVRTNQGMSRYDGSSLGGVDIDGAFIYPPYQPAAST